MVTVAMAMTLSVTMGVITVLAGTLTKTMALPLSVTVTMAITVLVRVTVNLVVTLCHYPGIMSLNVVSIITTICDHCTSNCFVNVGIIKLFVEAVAFLNLFQVVL